MERMKLIEQRFSDAKAAKEPINRKIADWLDVYNGKPYGNESDARSKIVIRDVYKTIESLKPNLSEPFVGSKKPIEGTPYTAIGEDSARASEKMLNYQFTTQLDRREFMNLIAEILPKEGSVWVKNEWRYDDEEYRTPMSVPKQFLPMIQDEYEVITDNGDSVDIEVIQVEVIENEGNLRVCRNEHIFTDPTAECDEDMQFLFHQYDTTMSDLKSKGVYKDLDKLETYMNNITDDTSLGSVRDAEAYDHGRQRAYGRNKITIVEYWGLIENAEGIAEQRLYVYEKKSKICIRDEENPMPDKQIPFERAVYIEEPFSLWGKGIADPMDDGQKIHTAFMRGIIDNAALANNGQKFIMKGGIDQMNFRRMVNGEKHIYMNQNPNEVMMDGSYNELPSSLFNTYEMIESQNEGITGISRINQGLDAGAMSQTATGVNTLTSMSQRRMLDTVRNVSNLLRKLFRRQLAYSIHFLDEDDWMRITGMQKPQGILGKDFDIKIDLITDAMKQTKISQFNLMLQNLQYVGEGVQFQAGNHILSKYFELFDEPVLAEMVKNQEPPKPDPMQVQMQQLEMQKLQAEVQEKMGSAQLKQAQAQKAMAEAQASGNEMDIQIAQMQLDQSQAQLEMQQEIQRNVQQMQIDMQNAQQNMQIDQSKAAQAMDILERKAELDMSIQERKSDLDIILAKEKASADIANKKAMAKATPKPSPKG